MPSFSRALEQSLHRALAVANERHHEYATLEHLLLALTDDSDAAAVHARLLGRYRRAEEEPGRIHRPGTRKPRHRRARRRQADGRLPARHPARRHPRAIVRPRGGDRRQRARRHLRRAREPRRLFPAGAGHDPLRRGQLHQPRHRQAARPVRLRPRRRAAPTRTARVATQGRQGAGRLQEEGRRARRLLRQPEQEGARTAASIR